MVKVVTGISDFDALINHFKASEDLRNVLMDLARRAVKAGHTVPGVIVVEEADVR